jgi:uncharacterized protein YggE
MKKTIATLFIICLYQAIIAQQNQPANPFPKTISVSGSAEMEIVPDEIFVNITLSEYQKKGETKKDLETIKEQFLETCRSAGVPDSLVTIVFYSGYNNNSYYFIRKRKTPDLFGSITYQVKFKSSKLMDDLVEKLDDNATKDFQIVSTNHSRITEFRRQLKIKAVQAAKEKGIYLTEAIGEKLGEAVTISEPSEWQPFYMNQNAISNNAYLSGNLFARDSVAAPDMPEVDFKKMKLRFEVNVVFALK